MDFSELIVEFFIRNFDILNIIIKLIKNITISSILFLILLIFDILLSLSF